MVGGHFETLNSGKTCLGRCSPSGNQPWQLDIPKLNGTVVLAVVTAELPLAIKPRDCVSIFLRYNRVVLVLVAKLGMDVHLGVPESSAKNVNP